MDPERFGQLLRERQVPEDQIEQPIALAERFFAIHLPQEAVADANP